MQTFILFLIIYFIFKLVHSDGHSGFRQGEHVPSFSYLKFHQLCSKKLEMVEIISNHILILRRTSFNFGSS